MNKYEAYILAHRSTSRLYVGLEVKLRSGWRCRITGTDGEGRFWGVSANNPPHPHDTLYCGWFWDSNGMHQPNRHAYADIDMEAL